MHLGLVMLVYDFLKGDSLNITNQALLSNQFQ